MGSDLALDERAASRADASTRVLFVAWQNPESRSLIPIGRLSVPLDPDGEEFEFRYLSRAREALARPFSSFPDFRTRYRSSQLFPFFENRMVPAGSADFTEIAASLGLRDGADPFEVLASSGGMRATDTLEMFPEPALDRAARRASLRFLVRGVRHRPEAQDEIDRLDVGDRLRLEPEPDNEVDPLAVLVVPDTKVAVGWIPAYLCPALHRASHASPNRWADMVPTVRHIGDRSGPAHFRLLCDLSFPWPFPDGPFDSDEFSMDP